VDDRTARQCRLDRAIDSGFDPYGDPETPTCPVCKLDEEWCRCEVCPSCKELTRALLPSVQCPTCEAEDREDGVEA
jgi:hypothetical protein